jgi:hypothetical protein
MSGWTNGRTPTNPPGASNSSSPRRTGGGSSVDPFSDRFPDESSTFDELTDLFLGDLTPGRDAHVHLGTRSVAGAMVGSAAGQGGGAIRGTSAVRLSGSGFARDNGRPGVELLILGHLPALATIWGTQYLRDSARAIGAPVGSLRLQAGYASVEIFPESGKAVPVAASLTLEHALAAASRVVGQWVIRVDANDELEFVDGRVVQTVTLLTGADEAATIGAYRTIKQLASRFEAMSPTPTPKLRVVVIGSDAALASEVGEKLAATAKACLGREVSCHVAAARIGTVRPAQLLYNGQADGQPSLMLSVLDGTLTDLMNERTLTTGRGETTTIAVHNLKPPTTQPVQPGSAGNEESQPPLRVEPPVSPSHSIDLEPDEWMASAPNAGTLITQTAETAAQLAASIPAAIESTPVNSAPARPRANMPLPHTAPAELHTTPQLVPGSAAAATVLTAPRISVPIDAADTRLAVHMPSLRPLNARCPYAAGVEFALDDDGRLQVLARFDRVPIDETSLGVLLIAAEWAQAHGELLRAAAPTLTGQPDATIDLSAKPTMHVFTGEPKRVRRLLETDVRVHLLSPVTVAGETAWLCTALN